ncbi:MAG: ZIP zinc transporter, partial [Cyclobacteriaceae bacterium]
WLVFAGSYLFSITIIHIFPELYSQSFDPGMIGICVLIGFFLQQALEFLSSGVEHGHIHVHEKTINTKNHLPYWCCWRCVCMLF